MSDTTTQKSSLIGTHSWGSAAPTVGNDSSLTILVRPAGAGLVTAVENFQKFKPFASIAALLVLGVLAGVFVGWVLGALFLVPAIIIGLVAAKKARAPRTDRMPGTIEIVLPQDSANYVRFVALVDDVNRGRADLAALRTFATSIGGETLTDSPQLVR